MELIKGDDYHYSIVQIISYKKQFFWIQERFSDSFGENSLGLFIVDEYDEICHVEGGGLAGIREAVASFWDADA
jgi:hypothetical protein